MDCVHGNRHDFLVLLIGAVIGTTIASFYYKIVFLKSMDDGNGRIYHLANSKKITPQLRSHSEYLNSDTFAPAISNSSHLLKFGGRPAKYYTNSSSKMRNELPVNIATINSPRFHKIGGGLDKNYAYSAFFDAKGPYDLENGTSSITIAAGLKSFDPPPLFCRFYNEKLVYYHRVVAVLEMLYILKPNLATTLPYSPFYIICYIENGIAPPSFVSVTDGNTNGVVADNQTSLLPIGHREENVWQHQFGVCVQPMFAYDDALDLAAWIEFHRLMGVEKFTFYNNSIGPKVSCLMKSYGNLLEVFPWHSPYTWNKDLGGDGQFIASQDCRYRHKGISRYLLFVDVDEMIVPMPLAGNNYSEMIRIINEDLVNKSRRSVDSVASYIFRNGFFFREWQNPGTDIEKRHNLTTSTLVKAVLDQMIISTKILRKKSLERHTFRSKYIAIPEKAFVVSGHITGRGVGGSRAYFVPEKFAYSHHYRKKCDWKTANDMNCEGSGKIVESSATRFAVKVARKVALRISREAKHCNITP